MMSHLHIALHFVACIAIHDHLVTGNAILYSVMAQQFSDIECTVMCLMYSILSFTVKQDVNLLWSTARIPFLIHIRVTQNAHNKNTRKIAFVRPRDALEYAKFLLTSRFGSMSLSICPKTQKLHQKIKLNGYKTNEPKEVQN